MRKAVLSMVIVLMATSGLFAQIKGDKKVNVPVGRLVQLVLTVDGDEAEYSVLGGEVVGGFREYSDPKTFKIQLLGYQNGTGYVVVSSTKAGKLNPLFIVDVTVGDGKPVPPKPVDPVDPVDPNPPDDAEALFVRSIRAAAKLDGYTKLADLASGYYACAQLVDSATTVGDMYKYSSAAMKKAVSNVTDNVYNLLAKELTNGLPTKPDKVLTAEDKASAKKLFTRIAKAVEKASK